MQELREGGKRTCPFTAPINDRSYRQNRLLEDAHGDIAQGRFQNHWAF